MDTLTAMRVFTQIVESGSFSAAAERLDISPAMATKHVAALEDRLGARLLHRTTRRLSLTETGKSYHERCVEILAEIEDLERSTGERVERPRGLLRITAPVSFGISHLAPRLAEFLSRYPEVRIDLALNDRIVDLVEEGYDLAIRISRLEDSSLVARRLAITQMMLCASPDYLARKGEPRHPRDLSAHDCLGYTYWGTGEEWRLQGPDGPHSVRIRPLMQANNGDVLRALALAGKGIILQPDFLVGADCAAGRLKPLLPDYACGELSVYAVYPHRKHLSAKVRAMVELLAENLPAR